MTTNEDETTKTRIAVLESKWNGEGILMRKNASVRPMFDMLCDLHYGNTHEFVYEMVGSVHALKEAIGRLAWNSDITTLYIAAHGDRSGLHLHGGEVVSRAKLCNMLKTSGNKRRSLSGVYLGSCGFGTKEVAKFLLQNDPQLRWVAGYSCSSDFFDGTALDVMFFNAWFRYLEDDSEARPRELIECVAEELRQTCQGMINTPAENGFNEDDEGARGMGFSIYVRVRGPGRRITDLVRPQADSISI